MIPHSLIILALITLIQTEECPSPPRPLAAAFTPLYDDQMRVRAGELSCQEGFEGVGSPSISCQSGSWTPSDFLCATNVALLKPSFYNSNTSLGSSSLAVDGLRTDQSQQRCERLDSRQRVLTVDLRETLKVVAVQIFTHESGKPVGKIEVRVGDDVDQSENRLCWFEVNLEQGPHKTFRCPEVLAGRYVSLSVYSPSSPLYLCEISVLSEAGEVVSPAQCRQQREESRLTQVHANTCLVIQDTDKMNFLSSLEMCHDHNMSLIHNSTTKGGLTYNFVRDFFQEVSRTTKQRMLVWVGMERLENKSWHWTGGPSVEYSDWGAYEPGQTGACVVMDSQMRWAWNAIRCVISAFSACHGPPQWCPSPRIMAGVSVKLNNSKYKNGVSLQLTCSEGYAGSPSQSAVIRCEAGLWTSYSLSCSPHDCGLLPTSPGLSVTYPTNTTNHASRALVSCSRGEKTRQTSLTCLKEGWTGQTPDCDQHRAPPDTLQEDIQHLLNGDTEEQLLQLHEDTEKDLHGDTVEEFQDQGVIYNLGQTYSDKNICLQAIILAILIVRAF